MLFARNSKILENKMLGALALEKFLRADLIITVPLEEAHNFLVEYLKSLSNSSEFLLKSYSKEQNRIFGSEF